MTESTGCRGRAISQEPGRGCVSSRPFPPWILSSHGSLLSSPP